MMLILSLIMNNYLKIQKSGFSLVELSIVLVILGLLTGGVLTGRDLIRAAELRSISTTVAEYNTAINAFKLKFLALPGDMPNASAFWPECNFTQSFFGITNRCDGNGNNDIEGTGNYAYETIRGWQHLALSGLINGSHSGRVNDGCSTIFCPGINVPAAKIDPNVGYEIHDNIVLRMGKRNGISSNLLGGFLVPEEAWNIDKKMDDGKPLTGKVTSTLSINPGFVIYGCSTSATVPSDYNLSSDNQECRMEFEF